jgi:CRP-like cAMP-binding protein
VGIGFGVLLRLVVLYMKEGNGTPMTNRSLLHNVYLFKTLSPDQLDRIAYVCRTEHYGKGDKIFIQGDSALALYLIKYGSVSIDQRTRSDEMITVAVLGAGIHFGEMSFVDSEPRSATARAVEKSEVVILPYDKLNIILSQNADIAVEIYKQLAHFLCGRLRVTTHDLSFAREKNFSHF